MKNELMCVGMPTEAEFGVLNALSKTAAMSGLYNSVGAPEKIFMILLAARELGIPPMQALNGGIWNIQGKIEISARLMNSMIRRQGHSIKVIDCNAQICILEGTRADNGDSFRAQFSMEDAQKAGLAGRSTWKAYAEDMLYSRAMSRLARRLFSDVIGTAYVEGEIRDCKPAECKAALHSEIEIPAKTEEQHTATLDEFCALFPDVNPELISTYIKKYAAHWRKSVTDACNDYKDADRLQADFSKWMQKHSKAAA